MRGRPQGKTSDMLDSKYVRIDPRQVVYDIFENEILAINLETGAYYSMTGPSCRLWLLVNDGLAVSDIVDRFIAWHDDSPEAIAAAVHGFLARLSAEQLIVGADGAEPAAAAEPPPPPAVARTPLPAFEMKAFTDMQDLLLLDPIHDVEESGWPLARAPDAKPADE